MNGTHSQIHNINIYPVVKGIQFTNTPTLYLVPVLNHLSIRLDSGVEKEGQVRTVQRLRVRNR
jgi:hypothetical protein